MRRVIKMKLQMGIIGALSLILWTGHSHAQILVSCESAESIAARADDEICDYYVDASEDCFQKLNRRLALFQSRSDKTSASELLAEAEPIRKSYDEAIPIIESYLMGMDKETCGDQREKLDVMVDAFKEDLKAVKDRIKKLKK